MKSKVNQGLRNILVLTLEYILPSEIITDQKRKIAHIEVYINPIM